MNLPRITLREISLRDLLTVVIPSLLAIAAGFWVAFLFVKPAPPDSFVMSTGAEGGAYHVFAERYRQILALDGITIQLRACAGKAAASPLNFQPYPHRRPT